MHRCAWRKGCDTEAFTEERFCYYHSKRRGESITESGTARDQFSSEAIEIRKAEYLLLRAMPRKGDR